MKPTIDEVADMYDRWTVLRQYVHGQPTQDQKYHILVVLPFTKNMDRNLRPLEEQLQANGLAGSTIIGTTNKHAMQRLLATGDVEGIIMYSRNGRSQKHWLQQMKHNNVALPPYVLQEGPSDYKMGLLAAMIHQCANAGEDVRYSAQQ